MGSSKNKPLSNQTIKWHVLVTADGCSRNSITLTNISIIVIIIFIIGINFIVSSSVLPSGLYILLYPSSGFTYCYIHLPVCAWCYNNLLVYICHFIHLPVCTYCYIYLPVCTYCYIHLPVHTLWKIGVYHVWKLLHTSEIFGCILAFCSDFL